MPINITMPSLSPTMTEGNLSKWHKKEGDKIKAGDVIAEIETDKATMEVEAVDEGVLGKIIVPEGTSGVAVNTVIAVLLEEGENKSAIGAAPKTAAAPSKKEEAPKTENKPAAAPAPQAVPAANTGARVFASPLAKRIARDKGVNLANVKGSGPHGRIVRVDVEKAQVGGGAARSLPTQASSGPGAKQLADAYGMKYKELPNNNIKKITARRLQESKQTVPHFYLTVDCRIDALLETRRQINEMANGAYKLSVNDFVIKAAALALRDYPAANTSWTDEAVLQYEKADISVAVSTANGLMTPIVHAAEDRTLKEISSQVKDLAKRAREGKLKPAEFQGGTFTVSNLGMYGIKDFGAIINPPQSCILAVGAGIEQPVVENDKIVVGTVMSCTLSVDHRSVDGSVGAEYLQIFKKYIENPASLLV